MKTPAQLFWEAKGAKTVRPDLPGLHIAPAPPQPPSDGRSSPWKKLNDVRKAVKAEAASLRHYGTHCGDDKVRRVCLATCVRLEKIIAGDE